MIEPSSGLPADLQQAIAEQHEALLHFLRHGRTLSAAEMDRLDQTRDPRGDTWPEDSPQWEWLFTQVYDDPSLPSNLLGGLNLIRCYGARIIRARAGYRLARGECPPDVYDDVRGTVLVPHAEAIRKLLRVMPPPEWFLPEASSGSSR